MTKQLCIAALQNIKVSESLGSGDRLGEDIMLTNDPEFVAQMISKGMVGSFGAVEMMAIRESPMTAYRLAEVSEEPTPERAGRAVLAFLQELKVLQLALWLVKDNAVEFENAFLEWPHRGPHAVVSTNHWAGCCTTSRGEREQVTISREELRTARTIHSRLGKEPHYGPSEPTQPSYSRASRAFYFVQGARSAGALSLKVANYCSGLEAMLSTDSSELSHKLAERVAWLLGSTPEQRLSLFRRVKASYGIRSRVVHGSRLTQKKIEGELSKTSQECDEVFRQVILRIVGSQELQKLYLLEDPSDDVLEEKLLQLTLGMWNPSEGPP